MAFSRGAHGALYFTVVKFGWYLTRAWVMTR